MKTLTPTSTDPATTVVGSDLLLSRDNDGGVTLYTAHPDRPQRLGAYRDVASAWAAIDAIDLDEVDAGLAAAA